jgi:hypothetical protein
MKKNMRHRIQIFLSLLIITSCQQQKSEKEDALKYAKQVIETYFENDCKANYNLWADSIVLIGHSESKIKFKERFPSESEWCKKFNEKQRFYGEYSFIEYLNDYDLRIYNKSEFTNKELMMDKENDAGISGYFHESHYLFSNNDYYFSGAHLKESNSKDRINHQGNWEMIISKTDQGWKIAGTLP